MAAPRAMRMSPVRNCIDIFWKNKNCDKLYSELIFYQMAIAVWSTTNLALFPDTTLSKLSNEQLIELNNTLSPKLKYFYQNYPNDKNRGTTTLRDKFIENIDLDTILRSEYTRLNLEYLWENGVKNFKFDRSAIKLYIYLFFKKENEKWIRQISSQVIQKVVWIHTNNTPAYMKLNLVNEHYRGHTRTLSPWESQD